MIELQKTNSMAVWFTCINSRVYSLHGATNPTGDASGVMTLTDTIDIPRRSYRVGVSAP